MNTLEEGEVPNKQAKYTNQQVGKVPFNIKSTSYRTKVCDHFKKGACLKGNKCSYLHPKELQNVPRICKYFLGQGCSNQQCQFSHDLSKYQCKFYFVMGNCKEQNCRFSHDKWENEIAKQQWAADNDQFLKDCLQKRGTTGLGATYDEQYRMKIFDQFKPPQQNNYGHYNRTVQMQQQNYYQMPQLHPQPQQMQTNMIFQSIQPQNSTFNQIPQPEPLEQISDEEPSAESLKSDGGKQKQSKSDSYPQQPSFQMPQTQMPIPNLLQQPYQLNQPQFMPFQQYYFPQPVYNQKQQILLQQQQSLQQMQYNQQQSQNLLFNQQQQQYQQQQQQIFKQQQQQQMSYQQQQPQVQQSLPQPEPVEDKHPTPAAETVEKSNLNQKTQKRKIKPGKKPKAIRKRETIKQLKARMKKQKNNKVIQLPADPPSDAYKPGALSTHLGIPIRKPVAQFFFGF